MTEALAIELDLKAGDEVTLLVNGFGSTPLMELYLLNNSVSRIMAEKNIKIYRTFVGNYMTSIDMLGASVSVMKMNDELKELLDRESDAPAFKVSGHVESVPYVNMKAISQENREVHYGMDTNEACAVIRGQKISLDNIVYLVDKMSDCIIRNEVPFCELDSHAGDGDFGMSVAKGFKQLKREWPEIIENSRDTIGSFLGACSMVIMEYCGGASGPIWGSAFRAAGRSAGDKTELTTIEFAEMLQAAVAGIQSTGERSFGRGAVVGDKTLIDALVPCADSWTENASKAAGVKELFVLGAQAAADGAKATENIVARMGRAGTVGDRSLGYPDAGAYALGVIFAEISDCLK